MGASPYVLLRAQKAILSIVTPLVLLGCSSRAYFQDNALTPVFNLYNRNFIVAAPTALGNFVCGAPFFVLALAAIDPLVSKINPGGASGEGYTSFINGVYLVPATICGAATGLVFIPFSHICPENAWDYNFKTSRNVSWKCEREEPGFEVMWDIRPKDSVVEQEIVVTRERVYKLQIVFISANRSMSNEDIEFTVDGTYEYVTKESADTDHPVVMPEYSAEELEFLKGGGKLVTGAYYATHPLEQNERLHRPPSGTVRKPKKGVTVPVRIRIEHVSEDGVRTVHADELIETQNVISSPPGSSRTLRPLTTIHLKPGRYRLSVATIQESPMPPTIATLLRAVKEEVAPDQARYVCYPHGGDCLSW